LYTTRFYRLLRARSRGWCGVGASTSPLYARRSYWCIVRTMEAAGWNVRPYHTTVPSFSVWDFALASPQPFAPPSRVTVPAKFLDASALAAMFVFPRDMLPVPVEINRLDNQMLVRYEDEWRMELTRHDVLASFLGAVSRGNPPSCASPASWLARSRHRTLLRGAIPQPRDGRRTTS
jgi:hypothetical protein